MPRRLFRALPLLLGLALPAAAQAAADRAATFEAAEDPATLLRLAERMLGAGRQREAAELIERAEARLLTRSELANRAGQPLDSGAVADLAAARAALARRDRAGAASLVAGALDRLDRPPPAEVQAAPTGIPAGTPTGIPAGTPTGTGAAPAPVAGGGGPKAPGPAAALPLPGIAPQGMPVGGSTSPPVPIGPDTEIPRAPAPPGWPAPSSTKPPPL